MARLAVESITFTSENAQTVTTLMCQIAHKRSVHNVASALPSTSHKSSTSHKFADHSFAGWINIGPALKDEQIDILPQPNMISKWLSGRGPKIPMATWSPSRSSSLSLPSMRSRSQSSNSSTSSSAMCLVGIEHGTGPNALDRLSHAGITLPAGWHKVQDHPKYGVVVKFALDKDCATAIALENCEKSCETALNWMLTSCALLCPISLDDMWIAEVPYQTKPAP